MAVTRLGWDILKWDSPRLTNLSWITGKVRAGDAHTILNELARRFDAEVETIDSKSSWGYAARPVRGGTAPSEHNAGVAVDFNAPRHPLGATGTFSKAQVAAIQKILRDLEGAVRWGGDYPGRKDEMHFELQGGVSKLADVAAKIEADQKGNTVMSNYATPLPVGVRFTSAFGMRTLNGIRQFHAGDDFAPPQPGQSGVPVYAPYDFTVISVGRGNGTARAYIPYHSGRYVYLDLGTHGGDRMRFYVGHLASYSVRAGQRGKAGDQIGIMGGSGAKTNHDFAVHAHLGVSVNALKPVGAWTARSNSGWTSAKGWLESKGITVGRTKPLTRSKLKTQSKPKAKAKGDPNDYKVRSEKWLREQLPRITKGTSKNSTPHLIGLYQKAQLTPYPLVHDQVWGKVTDDHYRWVHKLQVEMNRWRKGSQIPITKTYDAATKRRVLELQRAYRGTYYKGYPDGVPGPVFCKMLGVSTYPH